MPIVPAGQLGVIHFRQRAGILSQLSPVLTSINANSLSLYSQPNGTKTGGGTLADSEIEFLVTPKNGTATTYRIYRNAVGDPLTNGLGSYTDVAASGSSQVVCLTTAPLYGNMYYRVRAFDAGGRGSAYSALYKFKSACALYDTFIGTNGTELSAHTGESGVTWAKWSAFSGANLVIDTNDLKSTSGFGLYISDALSAPRTTAQLMEVKYHIGSSGTNVELFFSPNTQAASTTFHFLALRMASGWALAKYLNGAATTVLDPDGLNIPSLNSDNTLTFQITQISSTACNLLVKNNGVTILDYNDSSPLPLGRVAFGLLQGEATGTRVQSVKCWNLAARYYPTISGQGGMIIVPPNLDTVDGNPVVLTNHGAGQNQLVWDEDANAPASRDGLLNAGYILATPGGGNWGNQSGLDKFSNMKTYVESNFTTTKKVIFNISMGGLTGALSLLTHSDIVGMYGVYPVCNLRDMYDTGWDAAIESAYGIAGDGSDYAAKTAGHDPMLHNASEYPLISYRFIASDDDVAVDITNNSIAFAALLSSRAYEASVEEVTGNHSDPSHWIDPRLFYARALSRS